MSLKERIRFYARKEYYHLGGDVEILVVPVEKVEELLAEAADSKETVLSLLGEGFHAAFRKIPVTGGRTIYTLIRDMPKDEWKAILGFVYEGMKGEVFGDGDTGPVAPEKRTLSDINREADVVDKEIQRLQVRQIELQREGDEAAKILIVEKENSSPARPAKPSKPSFVKEALTEESHEEEESK